MFDTMLVFVQNQQYVSVNMDANLYSTTGRNVTNWDTISWMSCSITIKPFEKVFNSQITTSFSGSGVSWIPLSVILALPF
jgi:hypothetical protein